MTESERDWRDHPDATDSGILRVSNAKPEGKPPMANQHDAPYRLYQETTLRQLVEPWLRAEVPEGDLDRKVLLELTDGPAPTGQLVRCRPQHQQIQNGRTVWTPER